MEKLIHCCAILGFATGCFAQSPVNLSTTAPPAKESKAAGTKPVAKDAGDAKSVPSRFVNGTDLDGYLGSMSSIFLIRGREFDPFGQPQDPDAKPVIKVASVRPINRPTPMTATPFSEIVGMLTITTIMPGEKCFLVGTRVVHQNDQLPLNFRGKQYRVKVIGVTALQIDFRNVDTNETAARVMNILPAVMNAGHNGIQTPGMSADRADLPIELESHEKTALPSALQPALPFAQP